MILYDEIHGNVNDAFQLGICAIWIGKKGITLKILENGFKEFRIKKGNPDYKFQMYTDIVPIPVG